MTTEVYTPGKLIQARKRLWRVDSQKGDVIHATAVDAAEVNTRIYTPIEEVEPGHLAPPNPEVVGYPQVQDLMLNAFRLSMLHSTAPLLSMQRSRAIPVDYQLVPVVMAMEQSPVRMLIADDVGLGKTIEAGLVMTELISRGMARRVLVICPASLREQWQEALDYFFHLKASIFSRRRRRKLEKDLPAGTNPWKFHDAFIVSVDYAKRPEIKSQILSVGWDIVIVDEAHQISKPHQSSADQTVSKDRWDLGKDLAYSDRVEHLLLLTATPHNGYTDTYASLLRLLDVEAVSGQPHAPHIHRSVAKNHVVQRRRKDVQSWGDDKSPFPDRDQDEVVVQPTTQELDALQAVEQYSDLIMSYARQETKHLETLVGWTILHLHKRALSSPEALRKSLENRGEGLEERLAGLTEPGGGLSQGAARANVLDEDAGELFDEDEIVKRSERVTLKSEAAIKAELHALDDLQAKAAKITPSKDSKWQRLRKNTLRNMLNHDPKVIIFTRYKDTMRYVRDLIKDDGRYDDVSVLDFYGGLSDAQRQERFDKFNRADKAVLVSTDAISEGLNLQHIASQVIHYELPWNPNRLEQRNGRVDRFGQQRDKVFIRTMVMDETLDAYILQHLVKKARQIRADYGFSPPFFGDENNILDLIGEHGLEVRLLPQQMSLFGDNPRPKESETTQDPFGEDTTDRIRQDSFYGQSNISLDKVIKQRREVEQAIGKHDDLLNFVRSGLDRFGCTMRSNDDGTWRIVISNPKLSLAGMSDTIEQSTFNPKLGLNNPEVEVLDLGHPLVRRLMDLIKVETLEADEQDETNFYGRTAVVMVPEVDEMTALYHLLIRFVAGQQSARILEDLIPVAIPLYGPQALTAKEARRLTRAKASPGTLTDGESRQVLKEALERNDRDELLESQIEARRQALIARRQELYDDMATDAKWLEDEVNLEIGSW
ncbi:MAG: helicase-related protein, partial [Chloroflexota bacterium]|nr:helicase-related protein [Chloroflexota bacterium]